MKNLFKVVSVIITIGIGFLFLMQKSNFNSATKNEIHKVDTNLVDFLGEPIEEKTVPLTIKAIATKEVPTKTIKQQELQNCVAFLSSDGSAGFEHVLEEIRQHAQTINEVIDLTEYQLRTKANEELVVQHIPLEETKNQVRVFKMSEDGFPDRIKKFPNYDASIPLRLQGALTLGALEKKIVKYKAVQTDGRNAFLFEITNDEITKIDFTNGRNQLICEDNRCQCLQF
ncbi:MAG: hypothetical protein WA160_07705 [Pseudobdellovibrio sp.]